MPIRFQGELDRLLLLAKERGADQDPLIRQRLAWCYGKVQIMRYLGMRTLTQFLAGHQPGPDAAITKLYWSEYHHVVTELAVDILGADAMTPHGRKPSSAFQTDDAGAPNSSASWVDTFLNARAARSTPGRRRSSATSSARWSSVCPRSRDPMTLRQLCQSDRSVALGNVGQGGSLTSSASSSPSPATRGCGRWRCGSGGAPPTGWWRRAPFLPCPRREYLRFRLLTQYGDSEARASPADVVNYLAWCRSWP